MADPFKTLFRHAWRHFPQRATVTFAPRVTGSSPFSTTYSLLHVYKEEPDKTDANPALKQAVATFHLPQFDLDSTSAPEPKVSDKITDGSSVDYYVEKVDSTVRGQIWVCECRRGVG